MFPKIRDISTLQASEILCFYLSCVLYYLKAITGQLELPLVHSWNTNKQTNGRTDRLSDRYTDSETDGQTNIFIDAYSRAGLVIHQEVLRAQLTDVDSLSTGEFTIKTNCTRALACVLRVCSQSGDRFLQRTCFGLCCLQSKYLNTCVCVCVCVCVPVSVCQSLRSFGTINRNTILRSFLFANNQHDFPSKHGEILTSI